MNETIKNLLERRSVRGYKKGSGSGVAKPRKDGFVVRV